MGEFETNIRELPLLPWTQDVSDRVMDRGNEMTRKLFVDLFSSCLQLLYLVLVPFRMGIIVMPNIAVAVHTNGNGVIEMAGTAAGFWNNMIHLDVYTTGFLANTAMPITPQKNFCFYRLVKRH